MSDLKRVTDLAERQKKLEQQLAIKEEELKAIKAALMQVKTVDLPELMNELNLNMFELADGSKVSITHDLRAYVRDEDKFVVFNWLRENNHGSIIKSKVEASFGKGEEKKAGEIYELLIKMDINAHKKDDIPWNTFASFAKECQREGIDLHEKIQIQAIQEAKIK